MKKSTITHGDLPMYTVVIETTNDRKYFKLISILNYDLFGEIYDLNIKTDYRYADNIADVIEILAEEFYCKANKYTVQWVEIDYGKIGIIRIYN